MMNQNSVTIRMWAGWTRKLVNKIDGDYIFNDLAESSRDLYLKTMTKLEAVEAAFNVLAENEQLEKESANVGGTDAKG